MFRMTFFANRSIFYHNSVIVSVHLSSSVYYSFALCRCGWKYHRTVFIYWHPSFIFLDETYCR